MSKKEKQGEQNLHYLVEGEAFDRGIPVHIVQAQLGDLQGLFNAAYRSKSGEQRVNPERFQLISSGIKRGSLDMLFQIAMSASAGVIPVVHQISGVDIWNCVWKAAGLIQRVRQAQRQNQHPTINVSGNNVVINFGDDNKIETSRDTYKSACDIQSHLGEMAHRIDGRKIRSVYLGELVGKDKSNISLSAEDKKILCDVRHVKEGPYEITCEIIGYDKWGKKGTLFVREDQPPFQGNKKYPFRIRAGQSQNTDYISAMLKQEIVARCILFVTADPFINYGERKISELLVTAIIST